jgi:hypothetical protein
MTKRGWNEADECAAAKHLQEKRKVCYAQAAPELRRIDPRHFLRCPTCQAAEARRRKLGTAAGVR